MVNPGDIIYRIDSVLSSNADKNNNQNKKSVPWWNILNIIEN